MSPKNNFLKTNLALCGHRSCYYHLYDDYYYHDDDDDDAIYHCRY